jgi:cytoskeletal protein RodZ
MIEMGLTVGQYLQRQRKEKKVPLEYIAERTRITLTYLQALEKDDFHCLPGEFFARGYLRTYAKFIQLDPAEVIAAYQRQVEATRRLPKDEELAARPSQPFLRNILNFFSDSVSAIRGATPIFSVGKAVIPRKN